MRQYRWIIALPLLLSCAVRPALAQQSHIFANNEHRIELGPDFGDVRIDGITSDVRSCSNDYEVCLTGAMELGIPKTRCSGTIDLVPATAKMQYASRDHHQGLQWMYHANSRDFIYEFDFDYNWRAIYHDFGRGDIRAFIASEKGGIDKMAAYRLPAVAAVPPLPCLRPDS